MIGFIYKYENKINRKVYIGQTTDLVNRKASHKYKSEFVINKFYNAVRKYGWNNFEFDILAQVEAESLENLCEILDNLEVQYIQQYDSFHHGYNATAGGHCYRGKEVSEEFRKFCRNRVYSEETREKMRRAAKNRVVSEETRQKLRENALKRNFGAYANKNIKKRNASIRKALAKPVLQIDVEGNIVNEFPTINEAADFILKVLAVNKKFSGIQHGLSRHCNKETKKRYYYGFEWKFRPNV